MTNPHATTGDPMTAASNPAAELTEAEVENHVCCVKRRLCKDEHFHQRDVERILAARLAAGGAATDEGHRPGCREYATGWLCVSDCTTVWHDKPAASRAADTAAEEPRTEAQIKASDDDRFWLCNPCDHEAIEDGSYCLVHRVSFDEDAPCPETVRRLRDVKTGALSKFRALADEWAAEGDEMTNWFASQVLYNTIDEVLADPLSRADEEAGS